jgi:hypothetical protein
LRYGRRAPLERGFSGRQGRTGTRVVPKHALGRPLTLASGFSPRTRYETAPTMSSGPAPLPGRVPPPLQAVGFFGSERPANYFALAITQPTSDRQRFIETNPFDRRRKPDIGYAPAASSCERVDHVDACTVSACYVTIAFAISGPSLLLAEPAGFFGSERPLNCFIVRITQLNIATRSAGQLTSLLPDDRFDSRRINASKFAAAFFQPGPDARNGLSLTCNSCGFRRLHSRVEAPDLPLRFPADHFHCPFDLRLRYRSTVCSATRPPQRFKSVAASTTNSTCRFPGLHSPSGPLRPSGSKRSAGLAAS